MKLEETGWPLIELGYGLIEVAEGSQGDKPALIFGRNGSGKIGDPTQPDRVHLPGETLAVVTFENVESLDVVLGKLHVIRERLSCVAKNEPCAHKWAITQHGINYHDLKCESCGETKRETCD